MPDSSHRHRLLLAEDDEINRQILLTMLADLPGLEVVAVADGRSALQRAIAQKFDLVILDQQMPHLTGERVIRSLRASRTPNSETPILLVTAAVDILSGAGLADETLQKPIGAAMLREAVERLLAR